MNAIVKVVHLQKTYVSPDHGHRYGYVGRVLHTSPDGDIAASTLKDLRELGLALLGVGDDVQEEDWLSVVCQRRGIYCHIDPALHGYI